MSIPSPLRPDCTPAEIHRLAVPGPQAASPARRFHHALVHHADEAALQRWWQVFGDEVLNHFVEACLKQNADLSLASQRVGEVCAGLSGTLEDMATHPASREAWCLFHRLRVRLVAATVRIHVDVVSLQERLVCVEIAIRHQSSLLQRVRPASLDAACDSTPLARLASLQELHLHRVRLRGERDGAIVGLAWLVGEPVELVLARIEGRFLPRTAAVMPATGTPDALQLRRPDLLDLLLQTASSVDAGGRTPADTIRREQAFDRAVCEVEAALVSLSSAIGESAPARAAALSAGNRSGALMQKLRGGEPDYEAMLEANLLYHGQCDREIEVRARGYRALVDLYEALGAGWPAPIETGEAQ